MENLKVYLDTSVISHLLQEDAPEKMADTENCRKSLKPDNIMYICLLSH